MPMSMLADRTQRINSPLHLVPSSFKRPNPLHLLLHKHPSRPPILSIPPQRALELPSTLNRIRPLALQILHMRLLVAQLLFEHVRTGARFE